ncbi:MAG: hypothetical protein PVI01_14300 [Gemmatimonadales bacterium]|jgi:hypothetical protein
MERLEEEAEVERSKAVDTGGPPCGEAQADGVPCEELGGDCEDCERAESESREIYKKRLGRSTDAG